MVEFFRYNSNDNGFTLLEVMIAVLLLSLSYVAVLESFSSSMQRLGKLEKRLEIFMSQDSKMTKDIRFNGPTLEYAPSDGEIFLEGTTYMLTIVASEDGLLQSLQLRQQ
jgi:type II secretion system protein I